MNIKVIKGIVLAAIVAYLISLAFAAGEADWSEMAAWMCSIAWAVLFHHELESKSK